MIKIPIKVLVVDDEKDFVEMFSLRLREKGEKVWVSYGGEEALTLLEDNPIDVVILDIRMPGMDGIETLKLIKSRFPIIEVILLTGHGSTETAVKGMKLGAFDYLMKPADFKEIQVKLESLEEKENLKILHV